MSENYDGNPLSYPVHVRLVQDGELASQAFLAIGNQDLADRTAYLKRLVDGLGASYTSVVTTTALAAINTTSLADGSIRNTPIGQYVFNGTTSPPAGTPDSYYPWIIPPTTGPGSWVLESPYTVAGGFGRNVALQAQGHTFTDNSDPPNTEMGVAVEYTLGTIGADSSTWTGTYDLSQSGFVMAAVNNNPSFDGGAGLGSHYGTQFDLTPTLQSFVGLKITGANLVVKGSASYGANLPNVMPAFGLITFDVGSPTSRLTMASGNAPARDTSGTVADYKLAHEIIYTCNQNNRLIGQSVFVRIFAEGGNHAVAGTQFVGLILTLSAF